jgi:hypothetical protein
LYLKFEGTESDYEISNNLGQVVERDKLYNGATTLDVGGFAKGVYNLRLWVGSAHQVKRFVVE